MSGIPAISIVSPKNGAALDMVMLNDDHMPTPGVAPAAITVDLK